MTGASVNHDTIAATMSSAETNVPYVISADANGLMRKWERREGHIFKAPSEAFFGDLADNLKSYIGDVTGHRVDVVSQEELHQGMEELVMQSDVPVISVDRAYFSDGDPHIAAHLDVTRAVDPLFVAIDGLSPRPGAPSIEKQLDEIDRLIQSDEVAVVDDVLFSGGVAQEIINHLEQHGKKTVSFLVGIAIGGGKEALENDGIAVRSVRTYDNVLDEVCERDFLAGIPMSGRTVYDTEGEWWSAPYFAPFGNAEGWASVPEEHVDRFSLFCLQQSLELWKAVNKASGRVVPVREMPRQLKMVARPDESIVDALSRLRVQMEV